MDDVSKNPVMWEKVNMKNEKLRFKLECIVSPNSWHVGKNKWITKIYQSSSFDSQNYTHNYTSSMSINFKINDSIKIMPSKIQIDS